MIARGLFFEGPRRVVVRDATLPEPAPGEVLVRALASAVSQGTELLLYGGDGPAVFDPSLSGEAAATYPRRYGYAWVGTTRDGERIFALAPHGSAHVLPAASLRRIRADVPPSRAALAANLETALTIAWDAEPAFGERAVVLGGGVVGILAAWVLARSGAKVSLVEPRERRRAAAAMLLGETAVAARPLPDGCADLVVEATGDPEALDTAIAWCAPEARVVVASFYGRRRAPIDLGDAFHRRRLRLISSQVSSIPARLAPRVDKTRRFEIAESLLEEPRLDCLVAPAVSFERAPDLYATLDGDEDALPAHVFAY